MASTCTLIIIDLCDQ